MSEIPVKSELLKWARTYRRLTKEDAAKKLNITIEALEALEGGELLPTLTLFEDISKKYRIPQATLFMEEPPTVPGIPNDFRTFESQKPRLSFEFSVAFSAADNFRRVLEILRNEDEEFQNKSLPKYSINDDPEIVAVKERERLELPVDAPIKWASSEAFNKWRAVVERSGVPVFFQKFPIEDCRGFTINQEGSIPLIVINKSEPYTVARTFTLLHEYCHLLIGQPGLSDLDGRNKVEAFCNKFAAAILMPKDTLKLLIKSWPNSPTDWESKQIKYWASRLKVSQIALALRLEGLGLAPKGFAKKYNWHSGYTPRQPSKGGDSIATKLSELGNAYTSVIYDAYNRGAISESDAEQYLSIKKNNFQKVSAYVDKHRALQLV